MDPSLYTSILSEYFSEGVDAYVPHLSINCVVFKYDHPQLKVLFHSIPGSDRWYLPGGYVRKDESLDAAAQRNLKYSGIDKVFLRQVRTFGEVDRIPKVRPEEVPTSPEFQKILNWTRQRFISTVYYGLIRDFKKENLSGGLFDKVKWFDVDALHHIGLDHAAITETTRKLLATEILNFPIAANLLPDTFTLNELRGLFEVILGREIDRGSFRRKILQLGIVVQVDEIKESVGRPAYLYRFDREAYTLLLAKETKFGF